jgi:hypothetical protein
MKATDKQIIEWAKRHDIKGTFTEIQCAFEDAQTLIQSSQEQQEPVAHCIVRSLQGDESFPKVEVKWINRPIPGPLYTQPQAREWVGLTGEELAKFLNAKLGTYDLCLEVEAILKEKNT